MIKYDYLSIVICAYSSAYYPLAVFVFNKSVNVFVVEFRKADLLLHFIGFYIVFVVCWYMYNGWWKPS